MTPEYSEFLAHHGVKGQKWGVRNYQDENGNMTLLGRMRYNREKKAISKQAKRDADEYAKAKAYYGEGAGTRRKKIKNLTSERMKNPYYKEEFERFLSEQNMETRQKQANRERKTRDAAAYAGKTARSVGRVIFGVSGVTLGTLAVMALANRGGASKVIGQVKNTPTSSIGKSSLYDELDKYNWH